MIDSIFIITIQGNEQSEKSAHDCADSVDRNGSGIKPDFFIKSTASKLKSFFAGGVGQMTVSVSDSVPWDCGSLRASLLLSSSY